MLKRAHHFQRNLPITLCLIALFAFILSGTTNAEAARTVVAGTQESYEAQRDK